MHVLKMMIISNSLVWYDMVYNGMVKDGIELFSMPGMVWYGKKWNGMVWQGRASKIMAWYCLLKYGMAWHGMA